MKNKNKNKINEIFILKLVIPKQHQAIFLLTIKGTNPPKFYTESITFTTRYQVKRFRLFNLIFSFFIIFCRVFI
jgi:hypothetical protein